MPKAAPAAGTGTPVSGDHSNATEISSPIQEEPIDAPIDALDEPGSHRDDADQDSPAEPEQVSDEPEVPARLKGKSLKQVYTEFSGLEKDRSRLANEVGESRALLRQALEMALQPQTSNQGTDTEPEVTDDDFVSDPKAAVSKMVDKATKPLKEAVLSAEQRAAMLEFNARHPGYVEKARTPEFQEWVKSSSYRQRMFKSAAAFDMDAAEDLFAAWEEREASQMVDEDGETPAEKKREQIRRQTTETGGSGKSAGGKSGKKIYKSTELMRIYTQDRDRYNEILRSDPTMFSEKRVR